MKPVFGIREDQLEAIRKDVRETFYEVLDSETKLLTRHVTDTIRTSITAELRRAVRDETRSAVHDYFNSRTGLVAIGRGVELMLSDLLARSHPDWSEEKAAENLPVMLFPSLGAFLPDDEEYELQEFEPIDIAATVEAISIGASNAMRLELSKYFGSEWFRACVAGALRSASTGDVL